MSSKVLLLIASENQEQTEQKVFKLVFRSFSCDVEVAFVWLDPLESNRAVALIDGPLTANDLQGCIDQPSTVLAWAEPTTSLLVRTNGAASLAYGTTDKLRMLFNMKKRGGSPVHFVQPWTSLNSSGASDCYEVGFHRGWDAVLHACREPWRAGDKTLTVVPFFPCFKERLQSQLQRLVNYGLCINLVGKDPRCVMGRDSTNLTLAPESPAETQMTKSERKNRDFSVPFDRSNKNKRMEGANSVSKNQDNPAMEKPRLIFAETLNNSDNESKWAKENQPDFSKRKFIPKDERMDLSLEQSKPLENMEQNLQLPELGTAIAKTHSQEELISAESQSVHHQVQSFEQPSCSQAEPNLFRKYPTKDYSAIAKDMLNEMNRPRNEGSGKGIKQNIPLIGSSESKPVFQAYTSNDEKAQIQGGEAWEDTEDPPSPLPPDDRPAYPEASGTMSQNFSQQEKKPSMAQFEADLTTEKNSQNLKRFQNFAMVSSKDVNSEQKKVKNVDSHVLAKGQMSKSLSTSLLQNEVPLLCQNGFLGWLLSELKLENPRMKIVYESEYQVILLQCIFEDEMKMWKAALEAECIAGSKVPLYEQHFLMEEDTKSIIRLWLPQMTLDLNSDTEKPRLIISVGKDTPMDLEVWIASLLEREVVQDIPDQWLSTNPPWKEVQTLNPSCRIVVNERSLVLLAVADGKGAKEKLASAARDLNNLLVLSRAVNKAKKQGQPSEKPTLYGDTGNGQSEINAGNPQSQHNELLFEDSTGTRQSQMVTNNPQSQNEELLNGAPDTRQGLTVTDNPQNQHKELVYGAPDTRQGLIVTDNPQNQHKELVYGAPDTRQGLIVTDNPQNQHKELVYGAPDTRQGLIVTDNPQNQHKQSWYKDTANGQSQIRSLQSQHKELESHRDHSANLSRATVDRFIPWPKEYMEFCKKFLQTDLDAIEKKHVFTTLDLKDKGILIRHANRIDEVEQDLTNLRRQIKGHSQALVFPGLRKFICSSDGKALLENISKEIDCLFFTSDKMGSLEESLAVDYTWYNGILLRTARCGHKNIHLVYSKPATMEVDMLVEIIPSDEVHKASLKQGQARNKLLLLLPQWSAPEGMPCHKLFTQHRRELCSTLQLLFQQAIHLNCQRIELSTDGLKKADHPFPCADIAEAVGKAFLDAEVEDQMDLYIRADSYTVIFKAFEYMLRQCRVYFHEPEESDWNILSTEVSGEVPNYTFLRKNKGLSVNLCKQIPAQLLYRPDVLVCFPIVFGADEISIPSSIDFGDFSTRDDFQRKLQRFIFGRFPHELLPGETEFVSPQSKDFLVYCCSPWGVDGEKILDNAWRSFFQYAPSYSNATFIVPHDFPSQFLTQIVFKKLDSEVVRCRRGKNISFVLQSEKQYKAFDEELTKRTPWERTMWQKFVSYFLPEKKDIKEREDKSVKVKVTKTQTPSMVVTVLSKSDGASAQAANMLTQELVKCLKNNAKELQLDFRKIRSIADLELLVKNGCDVSAHLTHSVSGKKSKKKNRVQLSVNALTSEAFTGFIHVIHSTFGIEVFLNLPFNPDKSRAKNQHQKAKGTHWPDAWSKSEPELQDMDTKMEESGNNFGSYQSGEMVTEAVVTEQQGRGTTEMFLASTGESKGQTNEMRNERDRKYQEVEGPTNVRRTRETARLNKSDKFYDAVSQQSSIEEDQDSEETKSDTSQDYEEVMADRGVEPDTGAVAISGQHHPRHFAPGVISNNERGYVETDLNNTSNPDVVADRGHTKESEHTMDWEDNCSQTALSSQQFNWLYKSSSHEFETCDSKTNQSLEKAYTEGKRGNVAVGKGQVNLDCLTAFGKEGEKPLIRTEVFPSQFLKSTICPAHWERTAEFRLVPLAKSSQDYVKLSQLLQKGLGGYSVEVLQVEAVENCGLFRRYRCKQQQLTTVKDRKMWHRVSLENKFYLSRHGLHYNFMAIPTESRPTSDPVCCLFEDPRFCFSMNDYVTGREVCLVHTVVLTQDEKPFQTISSDAQAYPMHLVTLRVNFLKSC